LFTFRAGCLTLLRNRAWPVVFFALFALSCGYRVGYRAQADLPYKSVLVKKFANGSEEIGVEQWLYAALIERLQGVSGVRLVYDEGSADAVLEGRVQEVRTRAFAYSKQDNVAEYRLTMIAEVRLRRASSEELYWKDPFLTRFGQYLFLPNILEAEQNRKQAMQAVSVDLARDISDRILYPF